MKIEPRLLCVVGAPALSVAVRDDQPPALGASAGRGRGASLRIWLPKPASSQLPNKRRSLRESRSVAGLRSLRRHQLVARRYDVRFAHCGQITICAGRMCCRSTRRRAGSTGRDGPATDDCATRHLIRPAATFSPERRRRGRRVGDGQREVRSSRISWISYQFARPSSSALSHFLHAIPTRAANLSA